MISWHEWMSRIALNEARLEYRETIPGTLEHAMATLHYGKAIKDVEAYVWARKTNWPKKQAG